MGDLPAYSAVRIDSAELTDIQPAEYRADLVVTLIDALPRFGIVVVARPGSVPEVTDAVQAQSDPELAVLSAIAHGRDADIHKAAQIARAARLASDCLDEDRSVLYLDLIMVSLSEAARGELEIMKPARYEF